MVETDALWEIHPAAPRLKDVENAPQHGSIGDCLLSRTGSGNRQDLAEPLVLCWVEDIGIIAHGQCSSF